MCLLSVASSGGGVVRSCLLRGCVETGLAVALLGRSPSSVIVRTLPSQMMEVHQKVNKQLAFIFLLVRFDPWSQAPTVAEVDGRYVATQRTRTSYDKNRSWLVDGYMQVYFQ